MSSVFFLKSNMTIDLHWISLNLVVEINCWNLWTLGPFLLYHPLQQSWNWSILVSRRPSVHLSICLSICGQNRFRSVSFTILAGSISYAHILTSNFRRCVACKCYCKIYISMAQWKTVVSSLITHWSYYTLALRHRFNLGIRRPKCTHYL